jgi:thiamine transport system substrate-binding protein
MPAQGNLSLIASAKKEMMRHNRSTAAALVTLSLVAGACSTSSTGDAPESITLLAHDSFAGGVSESTFAAFTAETGIAVEVIAAGDAGSMVNQAILTKDNPLADVMFGVDDTFLSRALAEDIFLVHKSEGVNRVPQDLVDRENRVTPIDFGDVCINYDKEWFETAKLVIPRSLTDLSANLYASHFTVEHPATSSPGLAFMLATIDEFGEDGWLDYWADLRAGGVNVVSDWDSAYYGDFVRYGGQSSMVVSYASSPPAEVLFAEEPTDIAPTGVIEAGCYRQVEYAGVLDGTAYPEAAGLLVDFMLSVDFQETIPLTWFVFPANQDAELPQEFIDFTIVPENPARFSAKYISDNRDRWINEWIEVMEG